LSTSSVLFKKIQDPWIIQIAEALAQREGVRARFREYLPVLHAQIHRALEMKQPALLDPAIYEWAKAETESELDSDRSSLIPVLNQIIAISVSLARINFSEGEALELANDLLPVYAHAIEVAAEEETRSRVRHIETKIEQTNLSLQRLEKSKSDFISVAAHELKTPLTLIEGYASMMREALPQDDNQCIQAEIYLKGIDIGSRRMREIVDDMIDVSLLDNNLMSLNFQPVWLNRLLELVRRELHQTLQERKMDCDVKPFPGSNEMIFADGERLYQVFKNILLNAVKFTPDGGRILIDGRLLPGFIEVTIADTGIGIAPEDQTRIFEKFGRLGDAQLHSSGKTKFKGGGPGLGLPIARGIIDAHGGTIWVESEGYDEFQNPGSKFHIMLPLLKSPPDDRTAKLFGVLAQK
jgi:signal transduction histidine kinase